jgi:threonine synthase
LATAGRPSGGPGAWLFTETAGGVTIGALAKLAANGTIRPDETVVACVTGEGLKTPDAFGERFAPQATIEAKLEALREAVPW